MSFSEMAVRPLGGWRRHFEHHMGHCLRNFYPETGHVTGRGTTSGRFFTDTVSNHELAGIDWNGYIMHDVGHKMTTSDLWHFILTFRGSSKVTELDRPRTSLWRLNLWCFFLV